VLTEEQREQIRAEQVQREQIRAEQAERLKLDRKHRAFYRAVLKIIENNTASTELRKQYIVLQDANQQVVSESEKRLKKHEIHTYLENFMNEILDNRHLVFPSDPEYQRDHNNNADISLIFRH